MYEIILTYNVIWNMINNLAILFTVDCVYKHVRSLCMLTHDYEYPNTFLSTFLSNSLVISGMLI